jgi:hypothetical protein
MSTTTHPQGIYMWVGSCGLLIIAKEWSVGESSAFSPLFLKITELRKLSLVNR